MCQLVNPCSSGPCKNNGTCVALGTETEYFCDCSTTDGYSGQFCDTKCEDKDPGLCPTLAAQSLCTTANIGGVPVQTYCAKSCGACNGDLNDYYPVG